MCGPAGDHGIEGRGERGTVRHLVEAPLVHQLVSDRHQPAHRRDHAGGQRAPLVLRAGDLLVETDILPGRRLEVRLEQPLQFFRRADHELEVVAVLEEGRRRLAVAHRRAVRRRVMHSRGSVVRARRAWFWKR